MAKSAQEKKDMGSPEPVPSEHQAQSRERARSKGQSSSVHFLREILGFSVVFENRRRQREGKLTFIECLLCMSGLVQGVFIHNLPFNPHTNLVR